jgi:NhaP-type Na+/H+ or K+/H+ antiporter
MHLRFVCLLIRLSLRRSRPPRTTNRRRRQRLLVWLYFRGAHSTSLHLVFVLDLHREGHKHTNVRACGIWLRNMNLN